MTFRRNVPSPEQRAAERAERIARQGITCLPMRTAVMGGATVLPTPTERQKIPAKKRQAIRDSAKGEACTVRLPGVCMGDPAATIWSHARWPAAGKGAATKALDLAGAFACTACDAAYDGNRKPPAGMTRDDVDLAWCMGHFRSLVRLAQKGLL